MIEPEGSVTVPESVAPVTCAAAGEEENKKNARVKNVARLTAHVLNVQPLRVIRKSPLKLDKTHLEPHRYFMGFK